MLAAVLALVQALGGPAADAAAVPPLRVVSFNVYHGGPWSALSGHDGELDRRLELAARELAALDADVIGLQEASVSRVRGNVAERLATKLGHHWLFAPATRRVFGSATLGRFITGLIDFEEGPAIVSRFPIVGSGVHPLPRCVRFLDPRLLLHARIETPRGTVDVFSTHTWRDRCQIRRVVELVQQLRGPWPSIVMADFNVGEGSDAYGDLVAAGFVDAFRSRNPEAPGPTILQDITAARPTARRRVDYVFVVPGTAFPGEVHASRVVLDRPGRGADGGPLWPSDHYGVFATVVTFPPAPAVAAGD
jgi:endonuclease/exonuclease/phosphatase family metal-dependent hydrolase